MNLKILYIYDYLDNIMIHNYSLFSFKLDAEWYTIDG